ncbi:hypothetical protein GE09DRAFT_1279815 [Coniochaeta sp. 2T2.1]|nr:hypothetical protein GE09DRAFT_1279815 [Coniochaeta sp. 2T2.1]
MAEVSDTNPVWQAVSQAFGVPRLEDIRLHPTNPDIYAPIFRALYESSGMGDYYIAPVAYGRALTPLAHPTYDPYTGPWCDRGVIRQAALVISSTSFLNVALLNRLVAFYEATGARFWFFQRYINYPPGDILIFLPGEEDVENGVTKDEEFSLKRAAEPAGQTQWEMFIWYGPRVYGTKNTTTKIRGALSDATWNAGADPEGRDRGHHQLCEPAGQPGHVPRTGKEVVYRVAPPRRPQHIQNQAVKSLGSDVGRVIVATNIAGAIKVLLATSSEFWTIRAKERRQVLLRHP